MAFSFSQLIIFEARVNTTNEAFTLLKDKDSQIERLGNAACLGKIDNHDIWLGFKRGVPAWRCSCQKIGSPCEHAVAIALAWDRSRSVPDPTEEDITYLVNYKASFK